VTDRALAFPAAPLWRGSVSPGLSSNALPDRAGAAPAADQGLSPSSQYGSSLGAVEVSRAMRALLHPLPRGRGLLGISTPRMGEGASLSGWTDCSALSRKGRGQALGAATAATPA